MRRPLYLFFAASAALSCAESVPQAPSQGAPSAPAVVASTTSVAPASSAPARPAYPVAAKRPVTVTLGGASFTDDYAWLRDPDAAEVAAWTAAENDFTTSYLSTYPHLDELRSRFQELTRRTKPALQGIQSTPAGFFGLRREPSAPQPALIAVASLDAPEAVRVVVDPAVLDPTGQTSIDWFVASRDGKRVAISLSKSGSEDGSLSIFDATTGKLIDGPIPRVQYPTGGGSASFSGDGKQIFYTRYPAPGEAPDAEIHQHQKLVRHTIGEPVAKDAAVALDLPAIAEIKLEPASRDGTIVASVHIGDGGDKLWLIGRPQGATYTWTRFAEAADAVAGVELEGDSLYLISRKDDLRGAVLRVSTKSARLADAKVVVPASDREIRDISATKSMLVVYDVASSVTRARAFDLAGKPRGDVQLPERVTASTATVGKDGTLYLDVTSYVAPLAVYALDDKTLALKKTAVFMESPARFDDIEITTETATSKDGTKIPITILAKKGTPKSADVPALLTAYGGYALGLTPWFEPRRRVWLDQGGIVAIAHIRGGNELGEAWHRAGKLDRKQNVFDDFIASAERLVAAGYTSTKKLAITGRSNGGLLMGAALSQRPDIARAAVVGVPILDMARFEELPNGVFNTTEFGSIHDPAMAPKLLAYSPYQNTKPAAYPSVLLISGNTDGRVNPADARELTAKLQAITTSDHPVLLRTWMDSGHGMGTNVFKRAEEDAQTFAFLFRELDVAYKSAAPSK